MFLGNFPFGLTGFTVFTNWENQSKLSWDINMFCPAPVGGIGLVLLNWNGAELTIRCLRSVLRGSIVPDQIVIVDNASSDNSVDTICEAFSNVHIIRNHRNMGFAGGCNIGIQYLRNQHIHTIWLLNNDTEVDASCLMMLLRELQISATIGAVTGKILYFPPDNRIWYAGATFDKWRMVVNHRGSMTIDYGQYDVSCDVPFISGCCMLIRHEVLENIGLFDERFFAYAEDFDWCLRCMRAGYRLRYTPAALLYHEVSASVLKHKGMISGGSSSPLGIYLLHRNRIFIIRKHADNAVQKTIACIMFLGWVLFYAAALLTLRRKEKVKALLLAVKDGLMTWRVNSVNVVYRRFPWLNRPI